MKAMTFLIAISIAYDAVASCPFPLVSAYCDSEYSYCGNNLPLTGFPMSIIECVCDVAPYGVLPGPPGTCVCLTRQTARRWVTAGEEDFPGEPAIAVVWCQTEQVVTMCYWMTTCAARGPAGTCPCGPTCILCGCVWTGSTICYVKVSQPTLARCNPDIPCVAY